MIAIFFGKIARREPLTIFGDGSQSRDFTYVKDVVTANLLAVTEPTSAGEVFNIASGSPITLKDLAKTMLEVTNRSMLQIHHVIEHILNGEAFLQSITLKLTSKGFFYLETPRPATINFPGVPVILNFYSDPSHIRILDFFLFVEGKEI